MSAAITYRSFAKINLYLDVIERRRDGYHNIETIFQTVGLSDKLTFVEEPNRINVVCSAPGLEPAESNLVYRAATLLKERTGCTLGVRVDLEKKIPISAGLAGGSGNAAATLTALNTLWDLRLPPARLRSLALELGSDVPYCMVGGTVAATRRGEEIRRLSPIPKCWFVLLHPSVAVSTSRVYGNPLLGHSSEKRFAGSTRSFRRAIHAMEKGDFASAVFNRMEVPVFADHPHLGKAKAHLLENGCVAAAMSGSGSTLFGVCRTKREAQRVADSFDDFATTVVAPVPAALEQV